MGILHRTKRGKAARRNQKEHWAWGLIGFMALLLFYVVGAYCLLHQG